MLQHYNVSPLHCSYIIMFVPIGPGLLGEGPLYQIPNPERFVNKQGEKLTYTVCRICALSDIQMI
jgi:hypothetical protein